MRLPVAQVSELVAARRDERPYDACLYGTLRGGMQAKNFGESYKLRCPNDHEIDTVVGPFVTVRCPYWRGADMRKVPSKSIRDADHELAAIFHPTRNSDLTPDNTAVNYRKPLW
jgi:hypothetical protein